MATGSAAYSTKAGYNQSGGGYLYIVATLTPSQLQVYSGGSGSGGATTVGSFAAAGATDLPGGISTFFNAGHLVKDMGKTLVSAGRTFRKIQAVYASSANNSSPTFGVSGPAAGTVNPGYATFYVETGKEGAQGTVNNVAALVRFL